jgi:glycosyltransferase involved in cell wall biosynthesis
MLARCAIVVSNAGALPELIDDGSTGLIFHVSDAVDLADKISTFALNPEMRQRLGERAREVALERFSAKLFAERITAVLESESNVFRGDI